MMRTRRWRSLPKSGFGVSPGNQQQQLSRIVDALESLMIDKTLGVIVHFTAPQTLAKFRLVPSATVLLLRS
jgi:hypothetical protein